MKIKVLMFSFIFFVFHETFSQDTINWRPNYKLIWKDFQGAADSTSECAALTFAAINYFLDNTGYSFSTRVICYFNKKKSWAKVKSDTLLLHEQGHFNIAEIFARKLRRSFKNYKYNSLTVKQDLRLLFAQINAQRAKMDSLYDRQTNYSTNEKIQAYWTKTIAQELLELEQFK